MALQSVYATAISVVKQTVCNDLIQGICVQSKAFPYGAILTSRICVLLRRFVCERRSLETGACKPDKLLVIRCTLDMKQTLKNQKMTKYCLVK